LSISLSGILTVYYSFAGNIVKSVPAFVKERRASKGTGIPILVVRSHEQVRMRQPAPSGKETSSSMIGRSSSLMSSRRKRTLLPDSVARVVIAVTRDWPGRRRFGLYAFLPAFFAAGALLELVMIKWTVGETNFYTVYKRRIVEQEAQAAVDRELLFRSILQKDKDTK
jgi:hypothetical protein